MSENVRFYAVKMAARRTRKADSVALCKQLHEILGTVAQCEAMWALEDRIEKRR